jgi:hypothetical protein
MLYALPDLRDAPVGGTFPSMLYALDLASGWRPPTGELRQLAGAATWSNAR